MKFIKFNLLLILTIVSFRSYSHSFIQTSLKLSPIIKTNSFSADSLILDYAFKDLEGKAVRLSDFRGKFVFVDLWYSGCGFCISANNALKAVHEKLKNQNIVFLSVSIDSSKAKWISSISIDAKPSKLSPWAGKYVPAKGTVTLYTGGTGANNDFIKTYVPDGSYPKLLLIGPSGELISDHPPRPDAYPVDQPEKLVDFIMSYIKKKVKY